jgi:hypothetical protein
METKSGSKNANNRWISFVLAFMLTILFGILFYLLVFSGYLYLFPPFTEDGHKGMVLGQAFTCLLITIVISVIFYVIAYRKIRKKGINL